MKTVAIYVRVSTPEQSVERQIHEVKAFCSARGLGEVTVYADNFTGTKTNRPEFQGLLRACREGKHSTVVVQKLDRFSRSLKDLVTTLDDLRAVGVSFISVGDDIDMSTAAGKLMLHMVAAFAEFEASLIKDRVNSGIANAKRKGIHCGRPRLIIDDETVKRLAKTQSYREVAKTLGISLGSVAKIMKAA
jgi:putative DNA-invertase from lambdoid prophage Rac